MTKNSIIIITALLLIFNLIAVRTNRKVSVIEHSAHIGLRD